MAISINVILTTSDEVLTLRERVATLERDAEAAQGRYNGLEYRYRCECIINAELIDLCRASGVKFRPTLAERPFQG